MKRCLILVCLFCSSRELLISCAHAVSEAAGTTWLRNNIFDFDFSLQGQRATHSKHRRKWSLWLPQRISRPLAPRKETFLRLTTDLGRRYTNRRGMIPCQQISLSTNWAPANVSKTGLWGWGETSHKRLTERPHFSISSGLKFKLAKDASKSFCVLIKADILPK